MNIINYKKIKKIIEFVLFQIVILALKIDISKY